MSLSLGVHIGQQNISMVALRKLWKKLDSSGVDWISLWDHFYEAPYQNGEGDHFEALTTLATLAADTSHAKIGCLVFYVGYRNPALLAKAASTLDHISRGRFELGIGAGWHIWEARSYGYAFPDIVTRLDMLVEAAEIIGRLLQEPNTTFSGRHFQVDNATCEPKPLQKKMPLWIGGRGEKKTLEIVARRADGWNAAYVSPSDFLHLNQVLNEWCGEHNRAPESIRRGVNIAFAMATTPQKVKLERQRLRDQWANNPAQIESGALICTPEQAAERICEYIDAGAEAVNIALRAPWDEEALEKYLGEVIPEVRKATL